MKKDILKKIAAVIERPDYSKEDQCVPTPEEKKPEGPRILTHVYVDHDNIKGEFNPEVGSTIKGKFHAVVKGINIREDKSKSVELGIIRLITGK